MEFNLVPKLLFGNARIRNACFELLLLSGVPCETEFRGMCSQTGVWERERCMKGARSC